MTLVAHPAELAAAPHLVERRETPHVCFAHVGAKARHAGRERLCGREPLVLDRTLRYGQLPDFGQRRAVAPIEQEQFAALGRLHERRHDAAVSLRQVDEEPYDDYGDGSGTYTVGDGAADYSDDGGTLSTYGDPPDAGNAEVQGADEISADSSLESGPTTGQADDDEANAEASSVEPSAARPASIAES